MSALIGFVFLGLFSPGPNVILLTASGARFGFRRTLPHLIGVVLGVGITAFVTGLGLGALISAVPTVKIVLMLLSAAWILWMAWGLWNSVSTKEQSRARPFTAVEALLFQWVNPKVWAVAVTATAYLESPSPIELALRLGATFSTINLAVCLFWTYTGSLLSVLLASPVYWTVFVRTMAVALAAFSVLVFL